MPINAAILPAMTAAGFGVNSFISLGGTVEAQVQNANAPIPLTPSTVVPGPTKPPTGTQIYILQCVTYQVIPRLPVVHPGADLNNICGGNNALLRSAG